MMATIPSIVADTPAGASVTESAMASSSALQPPSQKRRARKKKSDPFLGLPDATCHNRSPSPHISPSRSGEQDPLLKRIFLNPLLSTSFVLSLYLIDRRNRVYRTAEHPTTHSPGRWSLSSWQRWLDPEPYQDASDSTWRTDADGTTGANPIGPERGRSDGEKTRSWFARKKHRVLARMEMEDAFELRDRLVWVLGAVVLLVVGLLLVGLKRLYVRWIGY